MSGSTYRCRNVSKSEGSHGVFRFFETMSRDCDWIGALDTSRAAE
jgi:hypothetical protein